MSHSIKVYVTKDAKTGVHRIHLREPQVESYKEVLMPKNSGYLLLSAQANVDALEDALEAIYEKHGDNVLGWNEVNTEVAQDKNWQRDDPSAGDSNAW
jgi:hypothetical protein